MFSTVRYNSFSVFYHVLQSNEKFVWRVENDNKLNEMQDKKKKKKTERKIRRVKRIDWRNLNEYSDMRTKDKYCLIKQNKKNFTDPGKNYTNLVLPQHEEITTQIFYYKKRGSGTQMS